MRRTLLAALLVAAAPLAAQETRFTPTIAAGGTLALENINGPMVITQGTGRTAEVIVTKRVIKGDGSYVKAIMEERGGTVRICTIYTNRDPNRKTCDGENSSSSRGRDNYDQVEMRYEVRVPAGVLVDAESVNGNITATGLEASAALESVNGAITFSGTTASHLETVNGGIKAKFTKADWDGTLKVSAVNGAVDRPVVHAGLRHLGHGHVDVAIDGRDRLRRPTRDDDVAVDGGDGGLARQVGDVHVAVDRGDLKGGALGESDLVRHLDVERIAISTAVAATAAGAAVAIVVRVIEVEGADADAVITLLHHRLHQGAIPLPNGLPRDDLRRPTAGRRDADVAVDVAQGECRTARQGVGEAGLLRGERGTAREAAEQQDGQGDRAGHGGS